MSIATVQRKLQAAGSTDPVPVAKSRSRSFLYRTVCPDCSEARNVERRRIGKPCHPCAMRRRKTHGLSDDKLYWLLKGMQIRCNYPSARNYRYYGGRGIKVCDEWANDPAAFVAWARANGYRPGLEIDRIDPDGNYEPGNCRFVTHVVNSRLRRNSRCSEERAEVVRRELAGGASVSAAAKAAGVPYMSAWHISKGNTWRPAG